MSQNFKLYDVENAPEQSRPKLKQIQEQFGMVPNFFRVLAESPAALDGYLGMMQAMNQTTLSPTERNVVILAASFENQCTYCMPVYSAMAKQENVDDQVIQALRTGKPLGDEKLEALRQLTAVMVRERGRVDDATAKRFYEQGYTQKNYLEVLLGVAFKTFANYMNHAAETPLDEPFKPMSWEPPAGAR